MQLHHEIIHLVLSESCLWQKKYVKIIYGSIIKSTLEDKNTLIPPLVWAWN